ncbi:hypothetical protein [Sneathiella glossodoripedis]|uniref:hypothetical protein n=1 Tax=Sneathiella glossodoripedis TaxID=418853 RepID=UPI0004722C57|nr:hypothetical protein [Sneathiella glossodoripedis]
MKKFGYLLLPFSIYSTAILLPVHSAVGASTANSIVAQSNSLVSHRFFSDKEIELIKDFFELLNGEQTPQKNNSKNKGNLPPGLAKKNELPPGLAKQLQIKGSLPPRLAKRQLPDKLHQRLPKRSPIFERVIVGNDILLIEKGTEIILDILRGVANK